VPDSTTLTNGIVHAVPRLVGGKGGKNLHKHNFFPNNAYYACNAFNGPTLRAIFILPRLFESSLCLTLEVV